MTPEPKYISTYENYVLKDSDLEGLKQSLFIIEKAIVTDSTLNRSVSRFLIGIDERNPKEQIVDFVIAWETLLLTVHGNSNEGELRYRFSLNGAALLSPLDHSLEFVEMKNFMRECYDIRSTIVHGGKKSVESMARKLGHTTISDLNNKLSNLYYKALLWLVSIEEEKRPYKIDSGWENLLLDYGAQRLQTE